MNRVLLVTFAVPEELDTAKVYDAIRKCRNGENRKESKITRLSDRIFSLRKTNEVVVVSTGIGKLDSYIKLKDAIATVLDKFGKDTRLTVLNVGTAASIGAPVGTVCECGRFIERDLIRVGYGKLDDYTIYTVDGTPRFLSEMDDRPDECLGDQGYMFGYSCNSGDSFVTDAEKAHQMRDGWTAVCDMEAFSQARIVSESKGMFLHPVEFRCVKYITDKIDGENSIETWEEELPAARMELTRQTISSVQDFFRS